MKYCELCEEAEVEEGEEFCIDCLWNAEFIQETPTELDFNIDDGPAFMPEPTPDIWGFEDSWEDSTDDDVEK